MTEITKESIEQEMRKMCAEAGFEPTDNLPKIANAKFRMFKDEWKRCPCDGKNASRFCISEQCRKDVAETGQCHCHCYQKKK